MAPIHVVADLPASRHLLRGYRCPARRSTHNQRQLAEEAPERLRLEAFAARARGAGAIEMLSKVREDPGLLIADSHRDIRASRVAMSGPMGSKRGTGRGAFIATVLDLVDSFYGDVLQNMQARSASPRRCAKR